MNQTIKEKNKTLVLTAFDTLFNKRDYVAAARYWSPITGSPIMEVKQLVRQAIKGLEKDRLEILPGLSKLLRLMSRLAPKLTVKAASGSVDAMLAQTKSLSAKLDLDHGEGALSTLGCELDLVPFLARC